MTILPQTLTSWKTELFSKTLKKEITSIALHDIPLQKATTQGGIVCEKNLSLTILRQNENDNNILIYVGMFFTEIVPSCSCGDEPMEINNYCEIEIIINKSNADTTFLLSNDTS